MNKPSLILTATVAAAEIAGVTLYGLASITPAHAEPAYTCFVATDGNAYLSAEDAMNNEPMPCVNLSDIADIDTLPVCRVEDCSDQIGQVGLWLDKDTGNWYLERGETQTYLIIDDTTEVGQ